MLGGPSILVSVCVSMWSGWVICVGWAINIGE